MTSRRKRLDKLIEHRSRELDKRISALAETRSLEKQAEESAVREREEVSRAERERRDAIAGPLDAKTLVEANDFLVSCGRRRDLAEQRLLKAKKAVQKAQGDVQVARNDLKKIELLTERLASEERVKAARQEQRATDELVSLRTADPKRRSMS